MLLFIPLIENSYSAPSVLPLLETQVPLREVVTAVYEL